MQINMRCFSCQTPFQVKSDEAISALNKVHEEGLKHYNAICPRCGKANKVSRAQLKRAAPGWKPTE
jgi:hypothetical protein